MSKEKAVSLHQRQLNEAKEDAAKICTADANTIHQALELANKEREQILSKKSRYMKSHSSIKNLSKEILYNDREEIIKSIDQDISESENRIKQLEKGILVIKDEINQLGEHSESLKEIKEVLLAYTKNLDEQKGICEQQKATRDDRIGKIEEFSKEYEFEIDKFEKAIQIKSAYINILTAASTQQSLQKESRRKKADLRQELIQQFSNRYLEFSNLKSYSDLEIIKIRMHYFNIGHNESKDADNALNWPENTLQLKLQEDIKSEHIDYFKFKEIIGRQLLDESSLLQTHETEKESKTPYKEIPLTELSQLLDKLKERGKMDSLEMQEIQTLADITNRPSYVFSYSFPPLFSVPTPFEKNQIDCDLQQAQAKYQRSISHVLEIGLALDARVQKQFNLFSEISNLLSEQSQKEAITHMSHRDFLEFFEYLNYQKTECEKEYQEEEQKLIKFEESWERFLGMHKSEISTIKTNLANAQNNLEKVNKLQRLMTETNPDIQKTNLKSMTLPKLVK